MSGSQKYEVARGGSTSREEARLSTRGRWCPGDSRRITNLTFPTPGGGLFPSEGVEDVNEKVSFQRRRRLGREPAPELACLDQRDNEPGQAERRNVMTDRSLGLATLEDACHGFRYTRSAAVQCGADMR